MIMTETERNRVINLVSVSYLYAAFFTNFSLPNGQETRATRNVIAKVALTKTITNGNAVLVGELGTSVGNCPSTTVASDAGNSITQVKLTSSAGFIVGDRVKIGNESDREVLSIASGIITFLNLSAIPSNGTVVKVKISQRAIIFGGTSALNDGEIAFIEPFAAEKDSSKIIKVLFSGVL